MEIFFYILMCISLLTLFFVGISEFLFEGKKFKWYYYTPQAVINTALGILGPYVLLFMLENAGEARGGVLGIIYLFGIILNNLVFFLIFFRKENFSLKFYFTCAIFCLLVISFLIWKGVIL